jgi:hypothetical protein
VTAKPFVSNPVSDVPSNKTENADSKEESVSEEAKELAIASGEVSVTEGSVESVKTTES